MWGKIVHPLRKLAVRHNNAIMRNELRPLIEAQFVNHDRIEGPRTIVNLANRAYVKESGHVPASEKMDPVFLDTTIEHIKMFLFAGHDTTASTLSFTYYYLHEHPDELAKVRAEHDAVFGSDPSRTVELICATAATFTTCIEGRRGSDDVRSS